MDLSIAEQAVFVQSEKLDGTTPVIKGYDFNDGIDYARLMSSYLTTGFQATHLACAIEVRFCNALKRFNNVKLTSLCRVLGNKQDDQSQKRTANSW